MEVKMKKDRVEEVDYRGYRIAIERDDLIFLITLILNVALFEKM